MIKFENVSVSFDGKSVFQNVSFELPQRGAFALTGPSGCGKTTLMRILLGLERGYTGTVSGLDGVLISAVFQEDRLLPWSTAAQNVAAALPEGESPEKWLELVGLGDFAESLSQELSGGMRRRVAIARALGFAVCRGAGVLLLDEAFTGLDAALKEDVISKINDLCKDKLILLVTHDEREAELMHAEKLVIFDGNPS